MKWAYLIASLVILLVLFGCAPTAPPSPTPTEGLLPEPVLPGNSLELCLNSRYSIHSLTGTANNQQMSNIVWATGKAPFTGTYRNIYVATPTAMYSYDPTTHSISWYSDYAARTSAFELSCQTQRIFDQGVAYMPALLASVSLWDSSEPPVASCPKGSGGAALYFGIQEVAGLNAELRAHSSISEGEPGWLPDPSTTGDNNLEEVLANLNYTDSFAQTNLTLEQISQLLWAGYGCTAHVAYNGNNGLTVPSAWADYYLTGTIYLVNENGVYRYHNRNPIDDFTTTDHRIEQINADDVRDALLSAVSDLPQAPCYVVICFDYTYLDRKATEHGVALSTIEYNATLEAGFVASNMLMQASAIDLGCYFEPTLTAGEQASIQNTTSIPSLYIPQVIVSIGDPQ